MSLVLAFGAGFVLAHASIWVSYLVLRRLAGTSPPTANVLTYGGKSTVMDSYTESVAPFSGVLPAEETLEENPVGLGMM